MNLFTGEQQLHEGVSNEDTRIGLAKSMKNTIDERITSELGICIALIGHLSPGYTGTKVRQAIADFVVNVWYVGDVDDFVICQKLLAQENILEFLYEKVWDSDDLSDRIGQVLGDLAV